MVLPDNPVDCFQHCFSGRYEYVGTLYLHALGGFCAGGICVAVPDDEIRRPEPTKNRYAGFGGHRRFIFGEVRSAQRGLEG